MTPLPLIKLLKQASDLAGRPVEVEQLTNGKFIVMWMSFGRKPPEPADTEIDAVLNFISYMEEKGDQHARTDGKPGAEADSSGEDNSQD